MYQLERGSLPCHCGTTDHDARLVVVTGGPGAGKTALLEMARKFMCEHTVVLPEAASIVFSGGFPRLAEEDARMCSQRAIFHVQHELEELVLGRDEIGVAVCDRGTLDGLAYWPGDPEAYMASVGTTREEQLARYWAVLHLEVPPAEHGYASTAMRIESPEQAAAIDDRISAAWEGHPRVVRIPSSPDFMEKMERGKKALSKLMPPCCDGKDP